MKLRSDSRAVAVIKTPIPFVLPATQAMFVKSKLLMRCFKLTIVVF